MYVKIIDRGECFSTTMEFIDGVYANRSEWEKHNFYPQNGMVGEVVKTTPSAYIVKIMDRIYVPMTGNGICEITYEEYQTGQVNNVCKGMDERQKNINERLDIYNSMVGYDWQRLPDLRQCFKQDVIKNITKLTCDFKYNIYLSDLEKSAEIYAIDVCLEYRNKSERDLDPLTIKDIVNQVCDVYIELFGNQFPLSSKNTCMIKVEETATSSIARKIVDEYYQKVNNRYFGS